MFTDMIAFPIPLKQGGSINVQLGNLTGAPAKRNQSVIPVRFAGWADGAAPVPSGQFAVVGFDVAGTAIAHYFNDQVNGRGTINLANPPEDSGLP